MKNIVIKNLFAADGNNYKLDCKRAREEISRELDGNDKEQCLEKVDSIEERNLDLAFGYSVFVKYGCGHWGHLQVPPHAIYDDLRGRIDRCSKCICGASWKKAGLSID